MTRLLLWLAGVAVLTALLAQPDLRQRAAALASTPYNIMVAVGDGIDMLTIEHEVLEYYEAHGVFPPEPVAACIMRRQAPGYEPDPTRPPMADHWSTPYQYTRLLRPEGYQVVSLGPDRLMGTSDDVVIRGYASQAGIIPTPGRKGANP